MNAAESLMLCRYVKAACPQQAMDKYTPDAWHDLLGDLIFDQAFEAVKALCKRQVFVAPSEIRDEVKETRYGRIARFRYTRPDDLPGGEQPTTEPEWGDWVYAQERAAARHSRMVNILVGDGLLAPGDPTPTYEDLRPLLDKEEALKAKAEQKAAEDRRAGYNRRLSEARSLTVGE